MFLPIFFSCARHEHIHHYLTAFIAALAVAVAVSFAIYFEAIPPINRATVDNPVPFATHVVYGPLLALAIYLLASRMLFDRPTSKLRHWWQTPLLAAMTADLFITDGRAGHVAFFVLAVVLCFQYLGVSLKTAGIAATLVFGTFAVAYFGNDDFRHRVVAAATGDAPPSRPLRRLHRRTIGVLAQRSAGDPRSSAHRRRHRRPRRRDGTTTHCEHAERAVAKQSSQHVYLGGRSVRPAGLGRLAVDLPGADSPCASPTRKGRCFTSWFGAADRLLDLVPS